MLDDCDMSSSDVDNEIFIWIHMRERQQSQSKPSHQREFVQVLQENNEPGQLICYDGISIRIPTEELAT
eukprot:12422605-Karenia_brevis.AAC.1